MLEESVGGQIEDTTGEKKLAVSQKEYTPTPYRATMWEGIELVEVAPKFKKISVEVVGEIDDFDPMFERFDLKSKLALTEEEQAIEKAADQALSEEVIEELKKQAYEEGLAAGKLEGLAEAQLEIVEKYEALATSMQGISQNIKNELFTSLEELEQKSLRLALDVAKMVLVTTVEAKPEYILDVIRNGLKHLGASKPIRIRVNPQDFEFLEVVGLPEDLTQEGAKIQYVSDELITSGCVVETDYGELNLELEKMWAEVKNNLFKAVS